MAVKILRGSRADCLAGLRRDAADLTEYPLRTYSDQDAFRLADQEIHIYQGVNTVPQDRFLVSLDDPAAKHAGLVVPGVVPFLVSTFQVTARRREAAPRPTQVGLPLLTTENAYLIKWMFGANGRPHAGHTLWRRLTEDELRAILAEVRPDERVEHDARTATSYAKVSGAVAAPEPADDVQPRAGGLAHEPWMVRSLDLATGWRVVVPNTSISVRPVVVPATMTIVGQNFNVLLCPSPEIALAIGAVLSRQAAQDYLTGISPWSQGETPRPRSKHVNTTLWTFERQIRDLLGGGQRSTLTSLSEQLHQVWKIHLLAAISLARGSEAPGAPLRERYRALEPREMIDSIPLGVVSLEGPRLGLTVTGRSVRIEFNTAEDAALAAVAAWTLIPQGRSIADLLTLRFEPDVRPNPSAVSNVLFDRVWTRLVGEDEPVPEPVEEEGGGDAEEDLSRGKGVTGQ